MSGDMVVRVMKTDAAFETHTFPSGRKYMFRSKDLRRAERDSTYSRVEAYEVRRESDGWFEVKPVTDSTLDNLLDLLLYH